MQEIEYSFRNEANSLIIERDILTKTIFRVYQQGSNLTKIQRDKLLTRYQHQLGVVVSKIEELGNAMKNTNMNHSDEGLFAAMEQKLSRIDERLQEMSTKITPSNKRADIVERFQAGQLQCIFAHPQSASHGLTLTKANTVIWSSPTYNAEHFQQFNRRIYRAGQTKRTEVICIAARHTWETEVYKKLEKKLTRMEDLLGTLNTLRKKHGRTNRQIQKT